MKLASDHDCTGSCVASWWWISLMVRLWLLQGRLLSRLFALFGSARNLRKRHVLVDDVVHRQVTLGNGVSAVGLMLLDESMHVRDQDVLGVFPDQCLVPLLPEDGCAETRTAATCAANAHTRQQLKGRDDGHREAPAAHGLAAQPCPEEACQSGIHERDDAADAGQALDARETSASKSTARACSFCTRFLALRRLFSCGGAPSGTGPRTATCDDPVEDDDAAQDAAHCGVSRVWRAAADYGHADGGRDSWQRCLRNLGQRSSNVLGGASEPVS